MLIADGVELCENSGPRSQRPLRRSAANHLVDKTRQTAMRSALRLEKACCAPGNEARKKAMDTGRHQKPRPRDVTGFRQPFTTSVHQNGSHSRQKLCQALQKPSATRSASLTIRLMMSPCVWPSMSTLAACGSARGMLRRAYHWTPCWKSCGCRHSLPTGLAAASSTRNSQQRQIVQYARAGPTPAPGVGCCRWRAL